MKALVGAFNQEKALVGAFSVIVQPVVEPIDRFTALIILSFYNKAGSIVIACCTVHSGQRCPARPDGDIRPEAILSTSFGSSCTAMHRQVTCTCQIWIPGWILPHFDVRTISVASKLKKLQIFLYY